VIAVGDLSVHKEGMGSFRSLRVLVCCLALTASLQAQQYAFRAYGQAEGLKNMVVNVLAVDRQGFLWVATQNGIYRFLGSTFEQYGPDQGIAELEAQDVVADPDGTVWVGTEANLYRWDGLRFHPAGRNPIPIGRVRMIALEDARHLLVVDKGQLFRLEHDEKGQMLSYLPVISQALATALPEMGKIASVNVVNEAGGGLQIWIGCGNRLYSWRDGKASGRPQPQLAEITEWGKEKGLAKDSWESVLLDHAGTLWVAGIRHVMALPKGAARFADRSIPGSDPENIYGHAPLVEDPEGRILAPSGDGVARWDGDGWRQIGRANGMLRTSHTMGMAFDAAGDLWLGTCGEGVYHWFGYRDWEGWSEDQGLPSSLVWSIRPLSPDRVLAGTDAGPAWINPRSGASGRLFPGHLWTYGQVSGMGVEHGDSLWAATISGSILRIDAKTGKTEQTGKLPAFIDFAMTDSAGRLFMTTKPMGVYVRDTPRAKPRRISAVDVMLDSSTRIFAGCGSPDGAVWFLAANRLLREENDKWSEPPIQGMPPLQGALMAVHCAANGAIWLAGEHAGTWRLTPAGDHLQAWKLELPAELRTVSPVSILVDRRGWVWLGTDGGLLAWNGQSWRQMTIESGLIWNDLDQGVLLEDQDGSVWAGTSGGVAHLLHPERAFDPVSLDVAITGIRRGKNQIPVAHEITLPWLSQPLQVQISSATLRNRSELILQYRMEGLQPDWIESTNGLAVFSALPPGNYIFEAIAFNPGLNAYSAPVRVRVIILSPWWRSYWFFTLCGVIALFLLVAISQLYARHLRAQSRELERLVQERTQELELSREQLRIQATHDGLTGMLNRTAILQFLEQEMERARRESQCVVVALIDLDHFKRINDEYGHLAGDESLRWFSTAVSKAIRTYDHAGRYGGEEFLLVLTQIPWQNVEQRLLSLHRAITNLRVCSHGLEFELNCSMGATIFDPAMEPANIESLLTITDKALYTAKAEGRNRVVYRSPVGAGSEQGAERVLPALVH
jgi:diguanylate cyclase (GGDEF)-like protein